MLYDVKVLHLTAGWVVVEADSPEAAIQKVRLSEELLDLAREREDYVSEARIRAFATTDPSAVRDDEALDGRRSP